MRCRSRRNISNRLPDRAGRRRRRTSASCSNARHKSGVPAWFADDQWRWKVFSGEIASGLQQNVVELRQYQELRLPVRSRRRFRSRRKVSCRHVPYSVISSPLYCNSISSRLCKEAGYLGPLNRCSIYGNKAAGAKFAKMLAMGQSRPWPDALEALTGQRQMDATAILDYFAPLKKWLDEQNAGHKVGWN